MLAQRCRRWFNINPALVQPIVFTGVNLTEDTSLFHVSETSCGPHIITQVAEAFCGPHIRFMGFSYDLMDVVCGSHI